MIEKMVMKDFSRYVTEYNKKKLLINMLDSIFMKKPNNGNIYYLGIRYADLLFDAFGQKLVYLVKGRKDRLFAIQHRCEAVPVNGLYKHMDFINYSEIDTMFLYNKGLNSQLVKCITNASVVIVDDVAAVLNRLIVAFANYYAIPTIQIQNGVFHKRWLKDYRNSICKYIFTWGDYFKEMYVACGFEREAIFNIGYPNKNFFQRKECKSKKVVFIGQDFNRYDSRINQRKNEIVRMLKEFFAQTSLSFYYKPHPGESLSKSLPDCIRSENVYQLSLDSLVSENCIIIGISSTMLFECAFAGLITIQVLDDQFEADDYSKIGFAYGVSSKKDLERLMNMYSKGDLVSLSVPPGFIEPCANSSELIRVLTHKIVGL